MTPPRPAPEGYRWKRLPDCGERPVWLLLPESDEANAEVEALCLRALRRVLPLLDGDAVKAARQDEAPGHAANVTAGGPWRTSDDGQR